MTGDSLAAVTREVHACRACPRLVDWREHVAEVKRASFAHETYWGRPVSGIGDPGARIVILGLAPAAHGGNRTGQIFTGDRSGDFLFAALHRAGLSSNPAPQHRTDPLTLTGCFITAAVRCAPPGNKPTLEERDRCLAYARREFALLRHMRVVLALGSFAWDAALLLLGPVRPRPRFAHGASWRSPSGIVLLGAFHPSQQNTFTGRLTPAMFDAVLATARELAT